MIWLAALGFIFAAGLLGITVLPALRGWRLDGIPLSLQFTLPDLTSMFARWDSGYYLLIAQAGYSPTGDERAFFPLYPLLVRWLSTIDGLSLLVNGLMLSVVSFGALTLMFFRWVRIDYDRELALLATALLCFSPVAFYFVAFYAEALFVLTSVLCLYFARRGQFLASGIAIALAGAARPTAFLLGFAYVIEVLQHRPLSARGWLNALAGLIVAPLGAVVYFLFLGNSQGLWAGIAVYSHLLQDQWLSYTTWPWNLLADAGRAIFLGTGIDPSWFSRAYTIHDVLVAVGGLLVAVWSVRHLRLSTWVFVLLSIGYVWITHGPNGYAFDSAPRHVGAIIPLYLAAAILLRNYAPRYQWAIVGASGLLLGIFAAWFTSGRWVS